MWSTSGYRDWISDSTEARLIGDTKIHSPQNGLLLSTGIHPLFDAFLVSVNPDVSAIDLSNIANRHAYI